MKIVFMGTPEFAVASLAKLIERHEVVAVITQPDKPKGRGKKMAYPPVKEFALAHDIEVLQPTKIKNQEFVDTLMQYGADIFVVAAYGRILPEQVLYLPKYGSINVHGSLLPKYRGAAPIQWAVINGERETGVTIMQMARGIDTGDMILKKAFEISDEDTYGTVHDKMAAAGADALLEALTLIEAGKASPVSQRDSLSSPAPMITKETGRINWTVSSKQVLNLIRGLNPTPGAYTSYEGDIIKLWLAEAVPSGASGKPGEIIEVIKNKGFIVSTGDGAVLVREMQSISGKRMLAADYMRGHSIETGKILGSGTAE